MQAAVAAVGRVLEMTSRRHGSAAASSASTPISTKLDEIQQRVGISFREVAQLMNTTPETVSRWRQGKGRSPAQQLQEAGDARVASDRTRRVFTRPADAKLWLFTPQRLLGGATPADRIEQGRVEDVLALIKQLQDGAFV